MKNYTLVIFAAGMGSRFGGLKQMTPIDKDGNFLIDYSIYDAIKAGFKKVVFVVNKSIYEDFKNTIGKRIESKIEVCYAIQDIEDIPTTNKYPDRVKPWGTVQALLATKKYIDSPFLTINADDFYGYNSYKNAISFMENDNSSNALITFKYKETINKKETVKRAVATIEGDDNIIKLIESEIEYTDKIIAHPLSGDNSFEIESDTLVSVNMFAFNPSIFKYLEEYFSDFFKNSYEYIMSHESLLPECVNKYLETKDITLKSVRANSKWIGMTYRSDLEDVKNNIEELKKNKEYPENLWR